jgi:hypothetical protein
MLCWNQSIKALGALRVAKGGVRTEKGGAGVVNLIIGINWE